MYRFPSLFSANGDKEKRKKKEETDQRILCNDIRKKQGEENMSEIVNN